MVSKAPLTIFIVIIGFIIVACSPAATETPDPTAEEPTEIAVITEAVVEATPEVIEETPEMVEEATEEISLTLVAPNPTPVESGITPREDVIVANVEQADAEAGERLYNETLVPACNTCHLEDESVRAIGPSLIGFSEIAGTRVDGQGALTYAYNSIRYANMHVVEGYVEGVMPVYDGILTDQEVYDLIAYIWTLQPE